MGWKLRDRVIKGASVRLPPTEARLDDAVQSKRLVDPSDVTAFVTARARSYSTMWTGFCLQLRRIV